MTLRDFHKLESGLSDILASVFQCTSEIGLWILNIHRTLHVLKVSFNQRLSCIFSLLFACQQSYLAT
jgi:hypothetical protein